MSKIGNTVHLALQYFAEPNKQGYYNGIRIRTASGGVHEGTLRSWKSSESPNLIHLDTNEGLALITRDSIESITVSNPAD